MIFPITQYNLSKNVYPNFKNTSSQNTLAHNQPFYLSKRFENIKTEDDFRKAQLEQNERSIAISTITAFLMAACAAFYILGIGKPSSKGGLQNLPNIYFHGFEGLKDNPKIPTLETCKSINKTLKEYLEIQLKQSKASAEIAEETGIAPISNRLLLYGPPGAGKSFFAKIYAKSLDAEYTEVLFSDFNSKWVGEGVENLKYIFEAILSTASKNPDKKYVVTFNEIDAIVLPLGRLARNSSGHEISKIEERSVVLNYMEILKEKVPNVTIIGTTNLSPRNNGLDKAAMSRFQNLVEVPYPDKEALFEALKMNLKEIKNIEEFITQNEQELKKLAEIMSKRKFSFRNLENMVDKSKQYYQLDVMEGKKEGFKISYLTKSEKLINLSDGELDI